MRFISKSTNLLVVLRSGIPAQQSLGLPAKPAVSVRFKDGIADVPEGELLDMMLAHQGYNSDYISVEDPAGKDPYAAIREESEPIHDVTELKFGTPVARSAPKGKLSPELQKVVQEAAVSLAKEMLPGMIKESLKGILEVHEASKKAKASTKSKKKTGRPKKTVLIEKEEISEEVIPSVAVEEVPIV